MPAVPRSKSIDERVVGTYQIRSRAVRRAFLLGFDSETNQEHPHRKRLLLRRLELLASVFAVDCLDVSVLDSSFDVIVRNRPDVARQWSDREVVERWLRLHRQEVELKPDPTWEEIVVALEDEAQVGEYRRRLSSISWYMAYVKEALARRFNAEDGVDGHFWAERFDCDRLESEAMVLACSAFVAASPVLAGESPNAERDACSSLAVRMSDELESAGEVGNQSETPSADAATGMARGAPLSGSDRRHSRRRISGWLAPLTIGGDGYDGVVARHRPTNEGFLRVSLAEYRDVVGWLIERECADRAGRRLERALPEVIVGIGISSLEWEYALRFVRGRFRKTWERAARMRAESRRRAAGRRDDLRGET